MNTDPWVFGPTFRYCNCRQRTKRGPTGMQHLQVGSLVLFGSTLKGKFVVDTVFVVGSAHRLTREQIASEAVADEAFYECTLRQLKRPVGAEHRFVLYRGATWEKPVHGMYSFVPSRLADQPHCRFERPSIELPGFVNRAAARAVTGARRQRHAAKVKEQWERVRNQVLAAGCVLAVRLAAPRLDRTEQPGRPER